VLSYDPRLSTSDHQARRAGFGQAWLLLAVPWVILAVALSLAATRLGAGATPDTGHYLAAAQNLLDGRGYVRLGPEIMASWPPAYPTMLAAGQLLGIEPLTWARALNACLLAICVALVVLWVWNRTESRAAAAAAGAMTSVGPPLLYVSTLALTELPFIAAVLTALYALDAWVQRPARRYLLLCAIAAAVACLIRYQGLALIATIALIVVALGREPLTARVKRAVFVGGTSLLPLGIWLIRNVWLTGEPLGPRFPSEYSLVTAIADLGRNAMSWFVPWRILLAHPFAGATLLAAFFVMTALVTFRHRQMRRTAAVCLAFAGAFAVMMLAAATRTAMDPLADRILSPMFVPLVVAAVVAATVLLRAAIRPVVVRRSAGALLTGLCMAILLARTVPETLLSWREGPGGAAHSNFNTERWRASPTLLWARDHVRGLAFASSPAALYLVGGVDARPMPRKHARRSPNVPMDRLADLHRDVSAAGSAYLVVADDHVPSHTFSLDELSAVFRLSEAARFHDGAVFLMHPKDVQSSSPSGPREMPR
jgi:hypothetical protein